MFILGLAKLISDSGHVTHVLLVCIGEYLRMLVVTAKISGCVGLIV
jgi:hypothetical protein